jgi:hypothetical protein
VYREPCSRRGQQDRSDVGIAQIDVDTAPKVERSSDPTPTTSVRSCKAGLGMIEQCKSDWGGWAWTHPVRAGRTGLGNNVSPSSLAVREQEPDVPSHSRLWATPPWSLANCLEYLSRRRFSKWRAPLWRTIDLSRLLTESTVQASWVLTVTFPDSDI